jgi:hypothetical protein
VQPLLIPSCLMFKRLSLRVDVYVETPIISFHKVIKTYISLHPANTGTLGERSAHSSVQGVEGGRSTADFISCITCHSINCGLSDQSGCSPHSQHHRSHSKHIHRSPPFHSASAGAKTCKAHDRTKHEVSYRRPRRRLAKTPSRNFHMYQGKLEICRVDHLKGTSLEENISDDKYATSVEQ